jgi:hypothetical protein
MPEHIIHRQTVTLEVSSQEDTYEMQNRISHLLKDELPSLIEPLLNKISPDGTILRIDKLDIDLGMIHSSNLENEFREKLIGQLSESLSKASVDYKNHSVTSIGKEKSLLDSLLFFLHHGYLPWYSNARDFKIWEGDLTESFSKEDWHHLILELKIDFQDHEYFLNRLAWQFSERFLKMLLSGIIEGSDFYSDDVFKDLANIWNELNRRNLNAGTYRFWKLVLQTSLFTNDDLLFNVLQRILSDSALIKTGADNSVFPLHNDLSKILSSLEKMAVTEVLKTALKKTALEIEKKMPEISEKNQPAIEETKQKQSKIKPASEDTDLIVENCGMVLLHPFLQMYFEELGMLEDDDFRSEIMQHRAVLLLHYLVTGETDVAETHLVFPKLLCAMDFNEPVPAFIDLTEKERTESETLLRSVLGHWEPLSRSSIESLQQTFLQREGKLIQTDTGWKVYAEQKAVDLLLNKLTWGISTIQLPWMQNVLNVEWF